MRAKGEWEGRTEGGKEGSKEDRCSVAKGDLFLSGRQAGRVDGGRRIGEPLAGTFRNTKAATTMLLYGRSTEACADVQIQDALPPSSFIPLSSPQQSAFRRLG